MYIGNRKQLIEQIVLQIARNILNQAREEDDGLFWTTWSRKPYGNLYLQTNEDLYNGVSGIALFMIACNCYFGESVYLEAARKAVLWAEKWVINAANPFYTLYTGTTGVIYAMLRYYRASGDEVMLERAGQLMRFLLPNLMERVKVEDLLSGNAGNIFVLAELCQHVPETDLITGLHQLTDRLIDKAVISRKGLKWEYMPGMIDYLTGVSHGNSGIAHVLMELGEKLQQEDLLWMAKMALQYENEHWSAKYGDWLDLRLYPEDFRLNGFTGTPRKRKEVSAWAHGTCGMGLVRLKASTLWSDEPIWKRQVFSSVERILTDMGQTDSHGSFAISTGYGSWLELLQCAGKIFGREDWIKASAELVDRLLKQYERQGFFSSAWDNTLNDSALLMGSAGIGYQLLRLLDVDSTPSILLPALGNGSIKADRLNWNLRPVTKITVNHFPRTCYLLSFLNIHGYEHLEEGFYPLEWQAWRKRLARLLFKLPKQYRPQVDEIFKLESLKIAMHMDPRNASYREIKKKERTSEYTDTVLENVQLINSRNVRIMQTDWLWPSDSIDRCLSNLTKQKAWFGLALLAERKRVLEFHLGRLSYLILTVLQKEHTFASLTQVISRDTESIDIDVLGPKIKRILLELLEKGLVERKAPYLKQGAK